MPTLYLMLGYPGAGKTTAAQVIRDLTGATHLWADQVRRERYGNPTYSSVENEELYEQLNNQAMALLTNGQNVVFDTSFNYFKDRENLRGIAAEAGADAKLIWVTVDEALARERATQDAHLQDSRVNGDMHAEDFDRLVGRLEPPQPSETYIQLDGTKITPDYITQMLGL
jgi:predicted kinase